MCCALLGRAEAQIDPDDLGEGIRVGLAAAHHSGQVGTVDLLKSGNEGTLVIVRVFSVPARVIERARIAQASSCEDPGARPTLELARVRGGISRSVVPLRENRLLAENAIVEVLIRGRRGLVRVSCAELRR